MEVYLNDLKCIIIGSGANNCKNIWPLFHTWKGHTGTSPWEPLPLKHFKLDKPISRMRDKQATCGLCDNQPLYIQKTKQLTLQTKKHHPYPGVATPMPQIGFCPSTPTKPVSALTPLERVRKEPRTAVTPAPATWVEAIWRNSGKFLWQISPWKINMSPEKGTMLEGKFIFQTSIFRGYVGFQGGTLSWLENFPFT